MELKYMETISEKEAVALFEDSPCTEEKRAKVEEIFRKIHKETTVTIDSNHTAFGELSVRALGKDADIDLHFAAFSEFVVSIVNPVYLYKRDIELIKECLDYLNSES